MIEQDFTYFEASSVKDLYYKVDEENEDMFARGYILKQFQFFDDSRANPSYAILLYERQGEDKMKGTKEKRKVKKVMKEYGEGKLHSGSKSGPVVTNPKQAAAIGYSEAKKKGKK